MACKACGGSGAIEKDGKFFECECSLWDRVGASMPSYILSAKFLPKHLESPLMRAFSTSCFITSTWPDMRAIIKAVMMKNHGRLVRITSDREVRDVYLGSKSRANSDEDSKTVYNSVEDLMGGGDPKGRAGGGPALVVVRLNELKYKNKAAAGALEEGIISRMDYGLSTWVVSNLDDPFTTQSYAYSDSLWDLFSTAFAQVSVPRIAEKVLQPEPEKRPAQRPREDSGPASIDPEPPPAQEERPRRRVTPSRDEDAPAAGLTSIYGSGLKKPQQFGKKPSFGRGD